MKQEIKQRWLAALRGGEYKQAKFALKNEHGFCCLGVLCDLHAKENGDDWERNERDEFLYKSSPAYLPSEVVAWAGLSNPCPSTELGGLSTMNDNGRTFDEIADIIEKEL